MIILRVSISLGVLLLLTVLPVAASSHCGAVVEHALAIVDEGCSATGRNEACHGYTHVEAQPRALDAAFSFEMGDIQHLSTIQSLRTMPLDITTGEWGVAFLRVQANLPDTLPGAASTFLLFGDAELEDQGVDANQRPMQSVRLQTGLTGVSCDDAPLNGLLIQTPEGTGERVELTINDVSLSLGSTIFFQAVRDDLLEVTTLEGTAELQINGVDFVVLPGETLRVSSHGNIVETGDYDYSALENLPLSLLDTAIIVPPARPPRVIPPFSPTSNGAGSGQSGQRGDGNGSADDNDGDDGDD